MAHVDNPSGSRRDFLYVATGAAGVIAGGAAVWPLVNQMNPSADVQALASIQVDVSGVEEGSQITVSYLGKPIFVRRRTAEDIATEEAVDLGELIDPLARNANLPEDAPATDANRALSEDGQLLVMWGVCTHLGCVPIADAGDFGGWFCPCHGSHYDRAGRIRRGPAPWNLPVPVASLLEGGILQLG